MTCALMMIRHVIIIIGDMTDVAHAVGVRITQRVACARQVKGTERANQHISCCVLMTSALSEQSSTVNRHVHERRSDTHTESTRWLAKATRWPE